MQQVSNSCNSWVTVTPSDTVPISCRYIYVGGTGDISVKPAVGGTAVVFKAVPVGKTLEVGMDQGLIMSTNTTATLLIALS